ncbi:DUF7673 family protein [Gulbenkiania mobilis]|uniref:DUF7673 family protein n=1 Tax=Gulbenkiania mobilis TaxID=397457 RepID=UPI00190FEC16|nr:hypothetical protein [Gulbenkiania mobilis]
MIAPAIYPQKLQQLVRQKVIEATEATQWKSQITCIGEWKDADGMPVQLQLCIQKDEADFMESPRPQHSVFCPEKAEDDWVQELLQHRQKVEQLQAAGVPALQRLLTVARGDTGQCRVIAQFLLGLYNDRRFPFPLTDLRCIDDALFEDCMAALRMDARACQKEVHCYFENGSRIWEQLAKDWHLRDYTEAEQP